jgi:DNA-directed RNA polymerase specialized sigma24 family protein
VASHEEFTEFAVASAPRLRRAVFLLCGDWHTAEDLAQTTLAKVFVSWRKVRRQDAAHAYATRILTNSYLASKRLRSGTEILADQLPEHPVTGPAPETRIWYSTRCPSCRPAAVPWWCSATGRTSVWIRRRTFSAAPPAP